MPVLHEGFIVHPSYQTNKGRTRIFLIGRLRTGETFAVVEGRARPHVYIRESDLTRVEDLGRRAGLTIENTEYSAIDGEACLRLRWGTMRAQQEGVQNLRSKRVRTYEGDLRFYDQYLIEHQIFGAVAIHGEPTPGRRVNWVFQNPKLEPCNWVPHLSTLSVDIENNPYSGEILSVSLATDAVWRGEKIQEVLFLGTVDGPDIRCFQDEKSLLIAFSDRVREIDPDIITGWNVLEFDFLHIHERFKLHGIPFTLGRSDQKGDFLPGGRGQSSAVIIPGRQVIDALRVTRAGPIRFDDNTLETVAREILGSGKVKLSGESKLKGKRKIKALLDLYQENPKEFCRYSLQDAILVIDILERTGLMTLTVRRAQLTGIGLARAWTSVASFEHLYISAMHCRRLVAPTHGVDAHAVKSAPGGAIIAPQPGLYDNVLVFDFKSLYPSIMRTFNVDPVSYISTYSSVQPAELAGLIKAPNGAYFKREGAILPDILSDFFKSREHAKKVGDDIASYVYKIIMNSFYGVLGTPGCRFAASDIAGAITSFGHHFLHWCQKKFEDLGHRVIYGDTDSLFLLHQSPHVGHIGDLAVEGQKLAARMSADIADYISDSWRVDSKLELEFEGIYLRFFLPHIRGSAGGGNGEMLGRAKGYAGLKLTSIKDETVESSFEIKGMEAVRRDWTDAAKNLQVELLKMVFNQTAVEDIRAYIRTYLDELRAGVHDSQLIYRKALRKPVSSYTKSTPPHVKAALSLDPDDRHGVIEYVWTTAGPQAVSTQSAPVDYEHYLGRQLKPIASGLSFAIKNDLESLFDDDKQSDLFQRN